MSAAHYRLPFDFRAAVTAIAGSVIARRRGEGEGRENEEKKKRKDKCTCAEVSTVKLWPRMLKRTSIDPISKAFLIFTI